MIVCPNCKHDNPEGATNCEACYTALPATKACPNCGASIQLDATFCGQCGHNLKSPAPSSPILLPPPDPVEAAGTPTASVGLPPTVLTPDADIFALPNNPAPPTVASVVPEATTPTVEAVVPPAADPEELAAAIPPQPEEPAAAIAPPPIVTYQLLHLQTNTILQIPPQLEVVHLGKPNDLVAPDIDVSSFPCAEVVSRVHANIRVEEDRYYIEDVGSANGTYINHNVLAKGNRHALRSGDRIGLGKGDLVTFIFQATE
ncbi:FHA domain-containing protein [Chamaesiphon minutus]|uniref:FHA domain-containing protein n=1 Tax=Chamaesiphon minutus (strain ATCC 27169 / PCC 6605) TaxID=1173020 RepID=K9UMH4_CHAP6|nr:FHA domain-containing protein [Chamaesiphon minutus]AFY96287.1 FHA domain-containing protein [Chamaesiphon minutus PCC 6605]